MLEHASTLGTSTVDERERTTKVLKGRTSPISTDSSPLLRSDIHFPPSMGLVIGLWTTSFADISGGREY